MQIAPSLCNSVHSLGVGDISDLFSDEDVDKIASGIRNDVRGLGMVDSRENCWAFFLARVQLQLKVRSIPFYLCIALKLLVAFQLDQGLYHGFELQGLLLKEQAHFSRPGLECVPGPSYSAELLRSPGLSSMYHVLLKPCSSVLEELIL